MASHTRLSPGIEYNEIDRSQYNTTENYSIVGTTVLMNGFTDKGENYTTRWINSKKTFEQIYGYPTNEPERYLYNGVIEVLNRGGVCLVSRLPYDNDSLEHFPMVSYKVDVRNIVTQGDVIEDLSSVDPSITSYVEIKLNAGENAAAKTTDLMTLEELDTNRTTNSVHMGQSNTIQIVDITNKQYGTTNLIMDGRTGTDLVSTDVECLGVMPVIVSPVNALFYQGIISSDLSSDSNNNQVSIHERTDGTCTYLSDYMPVADAQNRLDGGVDHMVFSGFTTDNYSVLLSSDSVKDETASKLAVDQFPLIGFLASNVLDKTYLKQIGVVVFTVTKDDANESRVLLTPVESYVGSLDKNSKDPTTKASNYIGNLINQSSQYINFFSNLKVDSTYNSASTIAVLRDTPVSLGFSKAECFKNISVQTSIYKALDRIFDKVQDPNQVNIDLIADAGVSTIAQYVQDTLSSFGSEYEDAYPVPNSDTFPFLPISNGVSEPWVFDGTNNGAWYNVLKKCDTFVRTVRKDCLFMADGLRPVFVEGNQKRVRNTNLSNTIENALIPNMKYLSGINSSYSAGYCNWFYVVDEYSGDFFWCPPSIKAAGVCVYTDAYAHPWDAPAGITRGVISDAYDTSFNPRNDEAGKIYQQAWNYAVNYPIDGIVIEGQKTFQIQQTALDRVNVRRLMLYIEKAIGRIARRFVYEGNTAYLRQRFTDMMKTVLDEVKTGNGISDYAVKCDDVLNTEQVIENNELRAAVAVKPVKTVEYIKLSFVVTNQSADVTEEVLRT